MSELSELEDRLEDLARQVAARLEEQNKKIVFAESCTGGKMAAAMTTVPGISSWFCGSAVTYRETTKTQWLSVSASELAQHTAESEFTTVKMAQGVLEKTPEADYCVAITGHLGPGVDSTIDGKVYAAAGRRHPEPPGFVLGELQLESSSRKTRQTEATCFALELFLQATAQANRL